MTVAVRWTEAPESVLSRWDARWKLGGLLALTVGAVTVTRPGPASAAAAAGLTLAMIGRLPWREITTRVGVLLLSVAPVLVLLPFTADWSTATTFALRLTAVGLIVLVLARTAPVSQTFAAAGAIGVPGPLVQIALLAYRYTFLFAGELIRLRRAWRVRGFRLATTRHGYRTIGQAVGTLAIRGEDRADRVAAAMRCRGFDGTPRPLVAWRTRPADVLAFVVCVAAAGLLVGTRFVNDGVVLPNTEATAPIREANPSQMHPLP